MEILLPQEKRGIKHVKGELLIELAGINMM